MTFTPGDRVRCIAGNREPLLVWGRIYTVRRANANFVELVEIPSAWVRSRFELAEAPAPEGRKDDAGKPRWELLLWAQLEDAVRVLAHGAEKYGDDNWQKVAPSRYLAAAFRHLVARAKGEKLDPESGLPHTAHAVCCLLFLAWHDENPKEEA